VGLSRPIISRIIQPVSRSIINGQTESLMASVGVSTSPTSNSSKSVSIGFRPKLVIPFGNLDNQNRSTSSALFSFGAGSSSSAMAAYSLVSVNGLTTTEATKHKTTSKIISQLTTTGSVLEEASLESFESSGFTLDWTSTNAAERILNHIAIGGGSLKCSVTQQQQNGTNAAQSFAHGLGANPTAVMFFSGLSSTAPPETTTTIKNSIGCWAGGEQFSVGQYAIDVVGTTNCRRALSVNSVMQDISTTFRRTMAVSTVDSTNVNCTYPVTTTSADRRFTMVAISGCKSQV